MAITDQTIVAATAFVGAVAGLVYKLTDLATKVEVLFRLHAQNDAKINDNALATPTAPTLNITAGTGQTAPQAGGGTE